MTCEREDIGIITHRHAFLAPPGWPGPWVYERGAVRALEEIRYRGWITDRTPDAVPGNISIEITLEQLE